MLPEEGAACRPVQHDMVNPEKEPTVMTEQFAEKPQHRATPKFDGFHAAGGVEKSKAAASLANTVGQREHSSSVCNASGEQFVRVLGVEHRVTLQKYENLFAPPTSIAGPQEEHQQ